MILKWVNSVIGGGEAQAAKQADEEDRKLRRDTKLVDLAHEALAERAARDRDSLEALIRMGWPQAESRKFKSKVREKVWDVVKRDVGVEDDDMIDEITERIASAAEADPYYKKIFDKGC